MVLEVIVFFGKRGSSVTPVSVVISNLYQNATELDVEEFLKGYLKKTSGIEIIRKKSSNNSWNCYALVHFTSERHARKALVKLDGKSLLGLEVSLHLFESRNNNF